MPQRNPQRQVSSRRVLAVILFVALVLRLGFAITRPSDAASIEQLPDQREYLELGENLLHGRGLVMHDPRFAGPVYAYRTPGYPLLIAMCGANPVVVRCAQAFLDTSCALAVFLLTLSLYSGRGQGEGSSLSSDEASGKTNAPLTLTLSPSTGRGDQSTGRGNRSAGRASNTVALVAALLVAINPYQIYFTGLLLSETLFIAMLCWAMVLFVSRNWWAGALLSALSVLVRPGELFLPLLLALAGWAANEGFFTTYLSVRAIRNVLVTCVLTVLVLAPWAYRNHLVLGPWIWTTTNGGITLYDGFNPNATGASDQRFVRQVPGVTTAGEVARDRLYRDKALHWARENPWRVVQLTLLKIARTWSPLPLSNEFSRPIYQWIGGLWAVPFDLLIVLGLCFGRLPWPAKVFLLIPAIYLTAIHAASVGSLRYRLPAEAPMAVLAALGAQVLMSKKTETSL